MNNKFNLLALLACIALPLTVGGLAGIATAGNIDTWYATLNKPSFNPPNYLFGPVWSTLYTLMGVSLYLIWQSPQSEARSNALKVFAVQLALNFAWSFIFFSFHQISLALVEIVLVWLSVLAMIVAFHRVHKTAAYLQLPLLMWVGFATALNAGMLVSNQ